MGDHTATATATTNSDDFGFDDDMHRLKSKMKSLL